MNQGLIHSQKIDVTQEHTIAPHQLQSLDILAANRMELEARITGELEENPVLEIAENMETEQDEAADELSLSSSSGSPEELGNESYSTENLDENRDDFGESLERFLENGTDFFSGEEQTGSIFDTLATEKSLQEQLLEQLNLSDAPAYLRPVAEEIIGNIGDNGYFASAVAEIAQTQQCSLETAEEALALVQTFDPPGIGARDLKECLLLQIARAPGKHAPRLAELIENHLDDIAKNRLPQVAKAMSLPLDQLQELVDELKKLAPHPTSGITSGGVVYVRPDIFIEQKENGEFAAVPARDSVPHLRLVSHYLKMLDDPFTPEDAKSYIREKIASAQQLMHNLEQRTSTIQRVAELIVANQHDFFAVGPEALKPMTMREIADKIGRDESTVSRAVAGKYMQTARGPVAMRDFFSGGFRQEDGSEISSRGIKEIIKDAVAGEDPSAPLSDSKIEALLKEQGFTVARRTIAKYREELGIASSQLRKVYH